jgi:hypothetical protein
VRAANLGGSDRSQLVDLAARDRVVAVVCKANAD